MKKLKGIAKITLRDAKTGKIVHQECHSNTVTPALARIMGDNLSGTLNYEKLLPLYSKLLGGVCLFNGTVSATDIFLPAAEDAELTAHAGQVDYDDPSYDTSRGIKGINGPVSNGYKWSWEWAQTQGNGTITDVCLTHSDTGSFWRENTSNNTMNDDFCPIDRVDNKVINPGDFQYKDIGVDFPYIDGLENIPIGFLGDVNHVLTLKQIAATTIEINLCKFTGSGAWIWNALGETEVETKYTITTPGQKYYVAYDAENLMLYFISLLSDNGYGYDSKLTGFKVDLQSGTSTAWSADCATAIASHAGYKKVQDGTSTLIDEVILCKCTEYPNLIQQLQVIDGSIFVPLGYYKDQFDRGMVNASVRIDLSDPTDQECVVDFYDFQYDGVYEGYAQLNLGKGRIMNPRCLGWVDENGFYKAQDILFDSTNIFLDTYVYTKGFVAEQPTDSPIQYFTYVRPNADGVRGCILNKLYQATVFHLETPVVKTASQTMTVDYTLIQQEEES